MSGAKQRIESVRRQPPRSKGWSDADAMLALDKRARLDSPDGSLTTWQDQGGLHAMVADNPVSVSYDPATALFTIAINSMRWGYDTPPLGHASQGLFQNESWNFNVGDGAVHLVYFGEVRDGDAISSIERPYLKFIDPDDLSVSSTGEIDPAVVPEYHHLVTINLSADGTYTIGDGPESSEYAAEGIRKPHVQIDLQQTYWAEITEHISGNNYRASLWRTVAGYFEKDDPTTARAPDLENQDIYAIQLVHGPIIGDDNPPFLATRTKEGRFEFQPAVWRTAR